MKQKASTSAMYDENQHKALFWTHCVDVDVRGSGYSNDLAPYIDVHVAQPWT